MFQDLMEHEIACGDLTVLLVDDEPGFRHGLAGALRDDGHQVLDFATVEQVPAMESLAHVTLVVTDYDMPGQSGLQLADRYHTAHPTVPILVVAAHVTDTLQLAAAERPYVRLLGKDYGYEGLHRLIHELARRDAD